MLAARLPACLDGWIPTLSALDFYLLLFTTLSQPLLRLHARLPGRPPAMPTACPASRPTNCTAAQPHSRPAAWLPGCLAAWLPGCLAAWLPGCLTALTDCLIKTKGAVLQHWCVLVHLGQAVHTSLLAQWQVVSRAGPAKQQASSSQPASQPDTRDETQACIPPLGHVFMCYLFWLMCLCVVWWLMLFMLI